MSLVDENEDYDAISIDFLKELDDNSGFMEEIDEITSEMEHQRITCEVCLKSYKTDATLANHRKMHIDEKFNEALVLKTVRKACTLITEPNVHASDVDRLLRDYTPDQTVLQNLVLYLNTHNIKNTELFYNRLFQDLMTKSREYFSDLSARPASVLCAKFCEVVVSMRNEKIIPKEAIIKNLNQKEIAGIQYLGGYVLRKVYSKLRDSIPLSEHNKEAMSLIMAGKSSENRDTFSDDLSREGGLWIITEEMEKVFVISEKYFSVQTNNIGIRNIDIHSLVDNLIQYPPLLMTFEQVADLHSTNMDKKIIMNTLSMLLHLFLKARTFSHTKDIVAKTKQKTNSKKALRKSIKIASTKEDTH